MKLDTLHCALLVAIVLLAVYGFGSFRESVDIRDVTPGAHSCYANCKSMCDVNGLPQTTLQRRCFAGCITQC